MAIRAYYWDFNSNKVTIKTIEEQLLVSIRYFMILEDYH